MFKSLKQNIKQRPTKFLVLILALIIPVLFFTRQKENTNQTTNKTLLPPPDISINSSITTPKRSISNLNQSLPNYAPITPLQPTNSKIIEIQVYSIAEEMNFNQSPTIKQADANPYYKWDSDRGYFYANQSTGQFDIKIIQNKSTSSIIGESDGKQLALNWLNKNLPKSSFLLEKTSYLKSQVVELVPTNSTQSADYYQFEFSPTINNTPIVDVNQETSLIKITVSKNGYIFSVNHPLPLSIYQTAATNQPEYPLKTLTQINQEIGLNLPIITLLDDETNELISSKTSIKNAKYSHIDLAYQLSSDQNHLVPVFKLTGTAQLENGLVVSITAYLSAIDQ
jgi:hypothetical protein